MIKWDMQDDVRGGDYNTLAITGRREHVSQYMYDGWVIHAADLGATRLF